MHPAVIISSVRNLRIVQVENVSCPRVRMLGNRFVLKITKRSVSTFTATIPITAVPVMPSVQAKKTPRQVVQMGNVYIHVTAE